MKIFSLLLLSACTFFANAQTPTVGLVHTSGLESDGYTLFTPSKTTNVYLINNCGERVHEWSFAEQPGLTCYLLENGNLLRAGKDSLQIRDWDNNVIWTYAMNANGFLQHHDIEPLPNGNILCVITDKYTNAEIVELGRDPAITSAQFRMDRIIELEPTGTNGASVVWEWKFADHLIQDYDAAKQNFGVVADHPELVDINFLNGHQNDYTHVNGLDYNAQLDQIIISPRHLSEVMIIDHSTTTAESSSHSGGNAGLGGDLLWRWGNPQVYKQGTPGDQKLFFQHDVKWVETGYLDEGKISVFNNGGDITDTYSSVHLIEPEIITGAYTMTGNVFNPIDFDWSWNGALNGITVVEDKKSGCHSLPNGNFIICESSLGRVSEITKAGAHLWSYINPEGLTISPQFTSTANSLTTIFRGEKYQADFAGLVGKDLTPIGIIENENSFTDTCSPFSALDEVTVQWPSIINPTRNRNLQFVGNSIELDELLIVDLQGRVLLTITTPKELISLPASIKEGMYIVRLRKGNSLHDATILIQN